MPSIRLNETQNLPRSPGLYYARKGVTILYIGMSLSLNKRWVSAGNRQHHKRHQLENMRGVTLHYRLVKKHRLLYEEAVEIKCFNPPLNVQKPNPKKHLTFRIAIENLVDDVVVMAGVSLISLIALAGFT